MLREQPPETERVVGRVALRHEQADDPVRAERAHGQRRTRRSCRSRRTSRRPRPGGAASRAPAGGSPPRSASTRRPRRASRPHVRTWGVLLHPSPAVEGPLLTGHVPPDPPSTHTCAAERGRTARAGRGGLSPSRSRRERRSRVVARLRRQRLHAVRRGRAGRARSTARRSHRRSSARLVRKREGAMVWPGKAASQSKMLACTLSQLPCRHSLARAFVVYVAWRPSHVVPLYDMSFAGGRVVSAVVVVAGSPHVLADAPDRVVPADGAGLLVHATRRGRRGRSRRTPSRAASRRCSRRAGSCRCRRWWTVRVRSSGERP